MAQYTITLAELPESTHPNVQAARAAGINTVVVSASTQADALRIVANELQIPASQLQPDSTGRFASSLIRITTDDDIRGAESADLSRLRSAIAQLVPQQDATGSFLTPGQQVASTGVFGERTADADTLTAFRARNDRIRQLVASTGMSVAEAEQQVPQFQATDAAAEQTVTPTPTPSPSTTGTLPRDLTFDPNAFEGETVVPNPDGSGRNVIIPRGDQRSLQSLTPSGIANLQNSVFGAAGVSIPTGATRAYAFNVPGIGEVRINATRLEQAQGLLAGVLSGDIPDASRVLPEGMQNLPLETAQRLAGGAEFVGATSQLVPGGGVSIGGQSVSLDRNAAPVGETDAAAGFTRNLRIGPEFRQTDEFGIDERAVDPNVNRFQSSGANPVVLAQLAAAQAQRAPTGSSAAFPVQPSGTAAPTVSSTPATNIFQQAAANTPINTGSGNVVNRDEIASAQAALPSATFAQVLRDRGINPRSLQGQIMTRQLGNAFDVFSALQRIGATDQTFAEFLSGGLGRGRFTDLAQQIAPTFAQTIGAGGGGDFQAVTAQGGLSDEFGGRTLANLSRLATGIGGFGARFLPGDDELERRIREQSLAATTAGVPQGSFIDFLGQTFRTPNPSGFSGI